MSEWPATKARRVPRSLAEDRMADLEIALCMPDEALITERANKFFEVSWGHPAESARSISASGKPVGIASRSVPSVAVRAFAG